MRFSAAHRGIARQLIPRRRHPFALVLGPLVDGYTREVIQDSKDIFDSVHAVHYVHKNNCQEVEIKQP